MEKGTDEWWLKVKDLDFSAAAFKIQEPAEGQKYKFKDKEYLNYIKVENAHGYIEEYY